MNQAAAYDQYGFAFEHYTRGEFAQALRLFAQFHEVFSQDQPCHRKMLECEQLLLQPDAKFNHIIHLDEK